MESHIQEHYLETEKMDLMFADGLVWCEQARGVSHPGGLSRHGEDGRDRHFDAILQGIISDNKKKI